MMGQKRITGKELRKALKGRTSYVLVAGTETWAQVSHQEVIFINERNGGLLVVTVSKDGDVFVEGNLDGQNGPSRVEYEEVG